MRKLRQIRPTTGADRGQVDAEPRRSTDDITREIAKREAARLALLRDYGRTLGS
jgi:hypothetical protein